MNPSSPQFSTNPQVVNPQAPSSKTPSVLSDTPVADLSGLTRTNETK